MLVGLVVALVLALVACSDTEDAVDLHLSAAGSGAVRIDGLERELPHRHRGLRGSSVNLEAVPAAGHVFERWDDGIVATENPTNIVMDAPRTVRAVFVPIAPDPEPKAPEPEPDPEPEPEPEPDPDSRSLSIERTGSGQGTIVSDPAGVDCGGTCAASFPQGSVVTLTATPAPGSSIAGWSGCASTEGATCTLTLSDDTTVTLSLDLLEPSAPANDDFAARNSLDGASGSTASSNVGATKEPGEPDHAGDPGGHSVWWTWSAPASGPVTFDVSRSGFDAVVAVYIGSTLTELQVPAEGVEPSALGDMISFVAVAGSAYQIAVDGRAGASGSVELSWSMPSAPSPAEWVAEPSTLDFTGQRGGAPPETQSFELRNDWDGDAEAAVGFSVSSDRSWLHVAPSTGSLEAGASASLEVSVSACTTTGVANGVLTVSGGGDTTTVTVGRTCEGADWQTTPSSISFVGEIDDATPLAESLTLRNAGNLAATFEVSAHDAAWLSVDPTSGDLGADASTDLQVSASACLAVAVESGTLVVTGGGHSATIPVSRDCREPYAPPPIALSIDRVYVNQSVPGQDSSQPVGERVPLIANRAGLLRVFATADDTGAGSAQARLHYRHGTGPEHTIVLSGPASVPTSTSEGSLATTYDVLLPASVLKPGLQGYVTLSASVDGESVDDRHPPSGSWSFDVRTVPAADFTLVPVAYRTKTPLLGDGSAYLDVTERVFPMANDTIDIRVSSTPLAFSGDLDTGAGWVELLYAVTDRQLSDPAGRHHYGVVDPGYSSGIAGIGWVGYPAAAGWSYLPSGSHVAAHELGHNWGLWHAPCGDPGDVDPAFPYPDGGIGVWGYDLVAATLRSPNDYADLMSYCQPAWVSDYHYQEVMDYRAAYGYSVHTAAGDGPVTVLLVQGWMDAETVHLDPLLITTLGQRPITSGPYTFIAWDDAGTEVLRVPFDTLDLSLHGVRGFHLTVPLPGTEDLTLSRVRLEHRGEIVLERSLPVRTTALTPTTVTHQADGRVTITWDARTYDALMVRDGPDGILLGRDYSGQLEVWPTHGVLELLFSDGLNTERELVTY